MTVSRVMWDTLVGPLSIPMPDVRFHVPVTWGGASPDHEIACIYSMQLWGCIRHLHGIQPRRTIFELASACVHGGHGENGVRILMAQYMSGNTVMEGMQCCMCAGHVHQTTCIFRETHCMPVCLALPCHVPCDSASPAHHEVTHMCNLRLPHSLPGVPCILHPQTCVAT